MSIVEREVLSGVATGTMELPKWQVRNEAEGWSNVYREAIISSISFSPSAMTSVCDLRAEEGHVIALDADYTEHPSSLCLNLLQERD
jgi:hypothetical protein